MKVLNTKTVSLTLQEIAIISSFLTVFDNYLSKSSNQVLSDLVAKIQDKEWDISENGN